MTLYPETKWSAFLEGTPYFVTKKERVFLLHPNSPKNSKAFYCESPIFQSIINTPENYRKLVTKLSSSGSLELMIDGTDIALGLKDSSANACAWLLSWYWNFFPPKESGGRVNTVRILSLVYSAPVEGVEGGEVLEEVEEGPVKLLGVNPFVDLATLTNDPKVISWTERYVNTLVKEKRVGNFLNQRRGLAYTEFLSEDFPRRKYSSRVAESARNIHYGQIKLHLSEVEYLLEHKALEVPTIVIYPGGGPGLHVPLLATLFPLVKFILVDPVFVKPEIKIHSNIFWVASLFDVDEALRWIAPVREHFQFLMFCDIRSSPEGLKEPKILAIDSPAERTRKLKLKEEYEALFEEETIKNMNMQLEWAKTLQVNSILKFRLRYKPGVTKYAKGKLAFQVFSRNVSTELRLWTSTSETSFGKEDLEFVEYDHTLVEEQMFYFNTEYRPRKFYDVDMDFGFNYDLVKTGKIFERYVEANPEAFPEKFSTRENKLLLAKIHDDFFGRKFLTEMLYGRYPKINTPN